MTSTKNAPAEPPTCHRCRMPLPSSGGPCDFPNCADLHRPRMFGIHPDFMTGEGMLATIAANPEPLPRVSGDRPERTQQ